jgi:hypothetical protein
VIVSAVVQPDTWTVLLTATSYTGVVDWYRAEARDVHLGTGPKVVDRTVPLNQPVTYYAVDDVSTVTVTPPVVVPTDRPVLSSTMSNAAYPVTVVSFRPYSGEGRSVWHPVIGRSDPFVSVFPALYPAGELVLWCADNSERVALIQFLQPGAPLRLRSTCYDRLDSMVFLMTSWSDPFPDDTRRSGPSELRIQYQRVTEVTPAFVPPARTYQDMLDESATYQVVLDKYTDYQALLDGVLTP